MNPLASIRTQQRTIMPGSDARVLERKCGRGNLTPEAPVSHGLLADACKASSATE